MGSKAAMKRRRRAERERRERHLAEMKERDRLARARELHVAADVGRPDGARTEAAVTMDAERSVCPRCGAPVDLFDLFGVFELRFDPPEVVADAVAAGGERRSWQTHVCREAEAETPTPPG